MSVPYDGLIKFTIPTFLACLDDFQVSKSHLIRFQRTFWYGCTSEDKQYKQKQDYASFSVCIDYCIIHCRLSRPLPSDLFDIMLSWHEGVLLPLSVFVNG
jgi:Na+-transporting NADH:ubiquinone oxidoreductase subunit NqrF